MVERVGGADPPGGGGRKPADTGLQVLGAQATVLLRRLDRTLEEWAARQGALSLTMPPLLPVSKLAALDFFENFPHQALLVSGLDLAGGRPAPDGAAGAFGPGALEPAYLALPTAACYAVYLHYEGGEVADGTLVTVLGRCFRREERYQDLRRLLGFHMREIVALGSAEFVQQHLTLWSERAAGFARALDLPLRKEAATDPFYDRGGARALFQQLSPVKHEFLFEGLAIASLNVHRNFFGERCRIRLAGTRTPIFTSCVAFGLERWIGALSERHGLDGALTAVERASGAV